MWEYHQPVIFGFLITIDITGLGKLRFVGGQAYGKIKLNSDAFVLQNSYNTTLLIRIGFFRFACWSLLADNNGILKIFS